MWNLRRHQLTGNHIHVKLLDNIVCDLTKSWYAQKGTRKSIQSPFIGQSVLKTQIQDTNTLSSRPHIYCRVRVMNCILCEAHFCHEHRKEDRQFTSVHQFTQYPYPRDFMLEGINEQIVCIFRLNGGPGWMSLSPQGQWRKN